MPSCAIGWSRPNHKKAAVKEAGFWTKKVTFKKKAGRLGVTSFATMILEVYYRHMPLYADKVVEEEFPL